MLDHRSNLKRPDPLDVAVVHDGDIVIVHPVGEIDLASAGQLRAVLNEAITSGPDLLVDLCDCPFMDSTGLGELLRARRRCADRDASFAVSCLPTGPPARVLQLAVGGHLAVHPTRGAGVRALRAARDGDPGTATLSPLRADDQRHDAVLVDDRPTMPDGHEHLSLLTEVQRASVLTFLEAHPKACVEVQDCGGGFFVVRARSGARGPLLMERHIFPAGLA